MILLLWLLGMPLDVQWVLPSTGVVEPLTRTSVARRSDGAFFVFDRFDHTILLFEGSDEKPRVIARKGLGPGELDRTNRIQLLGDKLYVVSAAHIQVFDADGIFLNRLRLPPGLQIFKTVDGWAGKSWGLAHEKRELVLLDESLRVSREVVRWEEEFPTALKVKSSFLEVPVCQELGDFCVSNNGRWLFYRLPNRPKIVIFDVANKREVGNIFLEKQFPFDERRGQLEVEELSSDLPGVKLKGKFPEFFPYSSGLYPDVDGGLVVRRLAGMGEHLLRFDSKGSRTNHSQLTLDQLNRVVATEGDYVFVTFTHKDYDDQGIAKVPKDKEVAFFAKYD